ncbi:hypothetical protein EVAR_66172_1 [Eumeta japonica]|uniref:Uncharacterized protein n=1 Tax=Eumeta variegata TaxID=151549 RepID=A0A4C1ZIY5_EUMVA|nr:hypothetical protein EVAR_66172_1 [Eumeta japonica]
MPYFDKRVSLTIHNTCAQTLRFTLGKRTSILRNNPKGLWHTPLRGRGAGGGTSWKSAPAGERAGIVTIPRHRFTADTSPFPIRYLHVCRTSINIAARTVIDIDTLIVGVRLRISTAVKRERVGRLRTPFENFFYL